MCFAFKWLYGTFDFRNFPTSDKVSSLLRTFFTSLQYLIDVKNSKILYHYLVNIPVQNNLWNTCRNALSLRYVTTEAADIPLLLRNKFQKSIWRIQPLYFVHHKFITKHRYVFFLGIDKKSFSRLIQNTTVILYHSDLPFKSSLVFMFSIVSF
jgi:hypothetical protein